MKDDNRFYKKIIKFLKREKAIRPALYFFSLSLLTMMIQLNYSIPYGQGFKKEPFKHLFHVKKITRNIASSHDKMTVADLKDGAWRVGGIFGPGGFVVKFKRELENMGYSISKKDHLPVFFENNRCIVYGTKNIRHEKIKRKRYGINMSYFSNARQELNLFLVNRYVRPKWLNIRIDGVSASTSLSDIEGFCGHVFVMDF